MNLPTPPWEPLCALEEGQHGAGELCLQLPGQMALLCGHLLASGEWSCWDLSLKLPCLGFKPRPVMEFLPKPYWCAPLLTLFCQTTSEEKENKHY